LEDKTQFENITKALDCIGFTEDEKSTLFNCIAAVLHIGNLVYKADEVDDEKVKIQNPDGNLYIYIYIYNKYIIIIFFFFFLKKKINILNKIYNIKKMKYLY